MSVTHVVGIDPGLVHTGVVNILFDHVKHDITVIDRVVLGLKEQDIKDSIVLAGRWPHIFIEGYRPRSNLAPDRRMQEGVALIKKATGGRDLDNMGIKKVVKQHTMELLGVWKFSTTTHHQDLRSAARIALLGMYKDVSLNRVVADVVRDHLEGATWNVVH